MSRFKTKPSPEEQLIVAQLHDWGHWRRLQTIGTGYKNHNNDYGRDECLNEDVSEDVNRAYNALRENHKLRADIIYAYYVDRWSYQDISDKHNLSVAAIRQHKQRAEGWIDHAVNH